MTAAPSLTWVTLQTFDSVPLAELAKVQLETAAIPCRLLNAEIVRMDWLLANAVGNVALQVTEDHLESAAETLRLSALASSEESSAADDGEWDDHGQSRLMSFVRNNRRWFFAIYLAMIFLSFGITLVSIFSWWTSQLPW